MTDEPWPNGASVAAAFTFDVDAEAGILATFPQAADWLDVMTHQAYGPRTGVPRLLRMRVAHRDENHGACFKAMQHEIRMEHRFMRNR